MSARTQGVAPARAGDRDQQEPPLPLSLEDRAVMTLQERSELVLSFARVLHINGQSTEETMAAAERLGNVLDLRAAIILAGASWNFRPETGTPGSSRSRRPIQPALTWTVWPPPCTQSTTSTLADLRHPPSGRRST